MKKLRTIKRLAREEAVKQGIATGISRKPIQNRGSKVFGFQRFNPLKNIERYSVKEYNRLNWKEKTNLNLQNKKYEIQSRKGSV
jgi:hypothetical protein